MPSAEEPRSEAMLDDVLLQRYEAGATLDEIFPELVDTYQPMLQVLGRRSGLSAEDTEELVQSTFLHLYRYLRDHGPVRSFRVFLVAIFRRSLLDSFYHKRSKNRPIRDDQFDLDAVPSPAPSAEESLVAEQDVLQIRTALQALTPDESRLLLLRFTDGKRLSEIADELNITYAAAASRLSRALHKLRDQLTGEGAAKRE